MIIEKNKILFVGNTAWSMYNFRRCVFIDLLQSGYDVIVVSPKDAIYQEKIIQLGCRFVPISIDAKGTNPLADLKLLFSLKKILKVEKPNICFFYTIKPNIYGSMVASQLNIPHIAVTTGLGYSFFEKGLVSNVVKWLYKVALRKALQVWFLNKDDRAAFLNTKIIKESKAFILKGEGIDLSHFSIAPYPQDDITFILMARMLWDKGVKKFVDAAKIVKEKYPKVKFELLGFIGVDNPNAIPETQINDWVKEGVVDYLGVTDDVRPFIAKSSCVVLPSHYGEGVPMCLLEGAAMARPLITTNSVGCKDVVDHGKTGWICAPQNISDLADVMEKIVLSSFDQRQQMGQAGREKMETEFDMKLIIEQYREAITKFVV